jgi:Flp pilus assembly protein TadG
LRRLPFNKGEADAAMADRSTTRRSSPAASRRLRRFARADDGAAAVEFAFVAIPFLILVFAIFELGLVFLVSLTLENGLAIVDRKIRTGDLQNNGVTASSYHAAVCREMSWLGAGCDTALTVDVRVMPSFANTANPPAPNPDAPCFDPGGPDSIVLVRAYYRWPVITPFLGDAVAGGGGDRKVTSAALFKNEPYSDTPAPAVVCPPPAA